MDALKILDSLLDSGAVDNTTALEVLKELHQRGVINLVRQLHEQNVADFAKGMTTRSAIDGVISRLKVMRDLIPATDDVLDVVDENQSVTEILGSDR